MPDSKKRPRAKTAVAKTRSSVSAPSAAPLDFTDIQLKYVRATEQIFPETHRRYSEAYNGFVAALQAVQSDLLQGGVEAYRTFVEQMQATSGPGKLYTRCADAYEKYTNLLRELWDPSDAQRQCAAAYQTFLGNLSDAPANADAQIMYEDAYRAYVEATKNAWDKSEIYQKTKEAHAAYVRLLLELHAEGQTKAGEACQNFDSALRAVASRADAAPRSEAAIRSYAMSLEGTWRDTQKVLTETLASALKTVQKTWEEKNTKLASQS